MTKVQWSARYIAAILSVVIAAGAAPAAAADVKFGGLIHGQYGMYTSNVNSSNVGLKGKGEFDITRIYITGEGKFSPTVKAKIVVESNGTQVNGSTDAHKANSAFLKERLHYLDASRVIEHRRGYDRDAMGQLRGEDLGPAFRPEDPPWTSRGLLGSADKGLGVLYTIPKGYGDVHAVYVNGEGYNVQEAVSGDGRYKDAAMRASISPMPENEWVGGVKLHMYVHNGQIASGEAKRRDRYLAGVSYQGPKGHLMYSASKSYQGNNTSNTAIPSVGSKNRRTWGQSLHGSIKAGKSASVFGRFDTFSTEAARLSATGATTTHTDTFNRGIIGVDYKLAEGVMVSLNDQWLTPITGVKKNENQVLVQFEAKF